jgi:hypothetical protein
MVLLNEVQNPHPMPRPPMASIQNPPKEAGQLTVQVVSFASFLSGQLFNLKCCTDLPTFATALLYELHTTHPMAHPPVAST